MLLGIEIGGTKLQLAVGRGDGSPFVELIRRDVDAGRGAAGIREQIRIAASELQSRHAVSRIGIGFGGPVLGDEGRVLTSHQIEGWTGFPLTQWCRNELGIDAVLGNDCDVAALAEARFGAGLGRRIVLYVTVGTGIGGGLVVDGRVHGTFRPAATEIGQLRISTDSTDPHDTVESVSSGRGIEEAARTWLFAAGVESPSAAENADGRDAADLRKRCAGRVESLTVRHLADAARDGNARARRIIRNAVETLGSAIATACTLLAPEVVIVGGGVSLMDADLFLHPLRASVRRFVFPPLAEGLEVVPAALGEDVVVHGALALAR